MRAADAAATVAGGGGGVPEAGVTDGRAGSPRPAPCRSHPPGRDRAPAGRGRAPAASTAPPPPPMPAPAACLQATNDRVTDGRGWAPDPCRMSDGDAQGGD